MATGGSIQLRLSLAGTPEVMAALKSLGPAGASAMRQIEQATAGPNAGLRAINAVSKDVGTGMEGLAGRTGVVGSALSAIGPAGLAAAAGIGAAALAAGALAKSALAAMQYGEAIETVAKKAGVTTDTVQQFRYAVEQSGGSAGDADGALSSFAEKFGAVGEGVKRFLPFLERLGFTTEQMASWKSTDEAVTQITDKIASLGNASDRAFFAQKVGLEGVLPALANGKDAWEKLKAEAIDVGAVMDGHTVKTFAALEEKFNSASDVIRTQFMSALVDLAPIIVSVMVDLASLARTLNDLVGEFDKIQDRGDNVLHDQIDTAIAANANLIREHGGGAKGLAFFHGPHPSSDNAGMTADALGFGAVSSSDAADYDQYQSNLASIVQAHVVLAARAQQNTSTPQTKPIGNFTPVTTGAAKPGPDAKSLADANQALVDQGAADMVKAGKDALTAQLAVTTDINARDALQKQINALADQEAADATAKKLEGAKARVDELNGNKLATQSEKDAAAAAYQKLVAYEYIASLATSQAQSLRDENNDREKTKALAEQRGAIEKEQLQADIDLLKAQQPLAHTMELRRQNALQLYDREEAQRQQALEAQIAGENDPAKAAQLRVQLGSMQATSGLRRQGASNANPSDPFNQWATDQQNKLPGIRDEWQDLVLNGVDRFNDSLFDSQGRLNNFQQIYHNVLSSMLKDVEQYLLKQAEVGMFGGGSSGGSSGGGINWMSMISSLLGGGGGGGGFVMPGGVPFADGGFIVGPGGPRSDSILASLSAGEFVVNAAAVRNHLPLLDAINNSRSPSVPRFASGGRVGAPGGVTDLLSPNHVTNHYDMSIHADGADPQQLQRVADAQQEWARNDSARWVKNYRAMQHIKKG